MWRIDSLEKTLMLGGIGGRWKGGDRGWDGWMASPTRWTWVWVNSGRWWWTGRPGVLQFMGSQRVGHDWATELIISRLLEAYNPNLLSFTEKKCSPPLTPAGCWRHELFLAESTSFKMKKNSSLSYDLVGEWLVFTLLLMSTILGYVTLCSREVSARMWAVTFHINTLPGTGVNGMDDNCRASGLKMEIKELMITAFVSLF